jgi:hypothetical protein
MTLSASRSASFPAEQTHCPISGNRPSFRETPALPESKSNSMSLLAISEQAINGLIISSFYALTALGLAVIFGVLRIVNFAHGELYMLGGYA